MKRIFVLLCALWPVQAQALSCIPYGVTDAYLDADSTPEGYVPVLGQLDFESALVPRVDWDKQQNVPQETLIPAKFKGEALGARGVPIPFETDVVLEINCAGPWCPNPQPGLTLAFLRKTSHSYVLHTNACGGYLFGAPTPAQIRQVKDCLRGASCTPSAPR